MIPAGGISAIVSILIIVICATAKKTLSFLRQQKNTKRTVYLKKIPDPIASVLTVLLTASAVLFSTTFIVYKGVTGFNNLLIAQNAVYTCSPFESPHYDKKIILRLDDVQSYGWTDTSIKIMEDTLDRGIPIVAGVIPYKIKEDRRLIRFLKREHCNIEIAMHGYTHGIKEGTFDEEEHSDSNVGEFALLDTASAKERVTLAEKELFVTTKKPIKTFIPPQNHLSRDAKRALQQQGISIISSEGDGLFDYHAASWDFDTKKFLNAESIIEDCEKQFTRYPLCVVMLHPQDFANEDTSLDKERYEEYYELLDYLETSEISVVTFSQYAQENGL